METRTVAVASGRFGIDVMEQGDGPPLVFLHGITGLHWNRFLDGLSEHHHVIAPRHPGFGDESQPELDTIHDLVYAYLDLLDALNLRDVPLVGHSLGGMIAAELAATQPERFSSLVLLAPMGFFHADRPTFDFFACTPRELTAALFVDAESEPAQNSGEAGLSRLAKEGPDSDQGQELVQIYLDRAKTLATAAKYLWPIPNRGLHKRIHRVSVPTLLVWGSEDRIVPPHYADDFLEGIRGSKRELIDGAGHELHLEQTEAVLRTVEEFAGVATR